MDIPKEVEEISKSIGELGIAQCFCLSLDDWLLMRVFLPLHTFGLLFWSAYHFGYLFADLSMWALLSLIIYQLVGFHSSMQYRALWKVLGYIDPLEYKIDPNPKTNWEINETTQVIKAIKLTITICRITKILQPICISLVFASSIGFWFLGERNGESLFNINVYLISPIVAALDIYLADNYLPYKSIVYPIVIGIIYFLWSLLYCFAFDGKLFHKNIEWQENIQRSFVCVGVVMACLIIVQLISCFLKQRLLNAKRELHQEEVANVQGDDTQQLAFQTIDHHQE